MLGAVDDASDGNDGVVPEVFQYRDAFAVDDASDDNDAVVPEVFQPRVALLLMMLVMGTML